MNDLNNWCLNNWCLNNWRLNNWRYRCLNDGRGGGFNNRRNWRNNYFNNRSGCIFNLVGCLLVGCLLDGLFFFNRSDLTNKASSKGLTFQDRNICINQS